MPLGEGRVWVSSRLLHTFQPKDHARNPNPNPNPSVTSLSRSSPFGTPANSRTTNQSTTQPTNLGKDERRCHRCKHEKDQDEHPRLPVAACGNPLGSEQDGLHQLPLARLESRPKNDAGAPLVRRGGEPRQIVPGSSSPYPPFCIIGSNPAAVVTAVVGVLKDLFVQRCAQSLKFVCAVRDVCVCVRTCLKLLTQASTWACIIHGVKPKTFCAATHRAFKARLVLSQKGKTVLRYKRSVCLYCMQPPPSSR